MKELIEEWIAQTVAVVLRSAPIAITLKGKLVQANESGVILELKKGRTFVPVASILHISGIEKNS